MRDLAFKNSVWKLPVYYRPAVGAEPASVVLRINQLKAPRPRDRYVPESVTIGNPERYLEIQLHQPDA
jgi:hypothetical protein